MSDETPHCPNCGEELTLVTYGEWFCFSCGFPIEKMHNMYVCGLNKRKKEYAIRTARTCNNCKHRSEKQENIRRSINRWYYVCKLLNCEIITGNIWRTKHPEVCPKHCFKGEKLDG